MKKIFLTAIVLAAAYTLSAQEVTVYRATDINTFQVPQSVQTSFRVNYPAATQVTWQPMGEYWYTTYKEGNTSIVHVYYPSTEYYVGRDDNYKVVLPVLNTYVPEDVVINAINTYGNDLYSITALKTAGSQDTMYEVTLIKDGTCEMVMMNGSGVASTNADKM